MHLKMSGILYDDVKTVNEAIAYLYGMVDTLEKECMLRDKGKPATELFIRINGMKIEITKMVNESESLAAKEVDLNEEIEKCLKRHHMLAVGRKEFTDIAKHFFGLGLSVNNPITAADRSTAEEIIINLKRVEKDYQINLTKEIEWLGNQVRTGYDSR